MREFFGLARALLELARRGVPVFAGAMILSLVGSAAGRNASAMDCNANGLDDVVETEPLRLRAGLEFHVGKYAYDSVAADFDGDGDVDVVINDVRFPSDRDYVPLGVVLLRNDGHGRFAEPESVGFSEAVNRLARGDFNGDGVVDLMAAGSRAALIAYGGREGRFESVEKIPVDGGTSSIDAGDLDGDGDSDVIVGSRGNSVRWAEQVDGKLQPFVAIPAIVGTAQASDADGDGDADLLLDDGTQLALNRGDGSFEEPRALLPPQEGFTAFAAIAADFDDDGRMDLAAIHRGQNGREDPGLLQVVLGLGHSDVRTSYSGPVPGDSLFGLPTLRRFSLAAGDLDSDGDLDLAVANSNSYVVGMLRNRGDGTFDDAETHFATAAALYPGLWFEDFDGDGHVDLGVGGNTFVLLRNEGQGELASAEYLPYRGPTSTLVDSGFGAPQIADFDGDGRLDVVVMQVSLEFRALSAFRNLGERRFAEPIEIEFASSVAGIVAVDLDADGRSELLVNGPGRQEVSVWRADESFHFSRVGALDGIPQAAAAAQLDADARTDLLGVVGDYVVPYFNRADGWHRGEILGRVASSSSFFLPLDLDDDEVFEVAIFDSPTGLSVVHDATVPTARVSVEPGAASFTRRTLVDEDGDGSPALWAMDRRLDYLWVFANEGGTLVGPPERKDWRYKNLDAGAIAAGDLNFDGRDDLVAGSAVLLTQADGSESVPSFFAMPGSTLTGVDPTSSRDGPSAIRMIDLDGDNRLDLLILKSGETGNVFSSTRGMWIAWNDSAPRSSVDCNLNRVPDTCDVSLADCDGDARVDACESDIDIDGSIDDCDEDDDGDLVADVNDECPMHAEAVESGVCGCGDSASDADGDTLVACIDNCPGAANLGQSDRDRDGVGDACDVCPLDARKTEPELCGCGRANSLADGDSDSVIDCLDLCPGIDDRRDTNNNEVADCADLCHPLKGGTIAESARGDGNCDLRLTASDVSAVVATMASNVRSTCGGEDVVPDCRADEVDIRQLLSKLFGS